MLFNKAIKFLNVVFEWKGETKIHLNTNHAFLNNNMHKGSWGFQGFSVIHSDSRLKNMWFMVNAIDLIKIF